MKTMYILLFACLGALSACVENDGPMERVGEEIDEAIEDVQTDGEDPANQLDDALDEVQDTAEDVADEVEDSL